MIYSLLKKFCLHTLTGIHSAYLGNSILVTKFTKVHLQPRTDQVNLGCLFLSEFVLFMLRTLMYLLNNCRSKRSHQLLNPVSSFLYLSASDRMLREVKTSRKLATA